jgi:Na+-transporting NADH:ubiquinone oxidoreductase subunit A
MLYKQSLKFLLVFGILASSSTLLHAQSPDGGTSPFFIGLIALVVFFLFAVIVTVANRLMKLTAERVGADKGGQNFSVFPKLEEFFGSGRPEHTEGANFVKLRKGYDIPLAGEAQKNVVDVTSSTYALRAIDVQGLSPIPKLVPAVGDNVKAGDVVFFDKKNPDVKYVAPVSGEIAEIRRGPKRRIDEVVILADKDIEYKSFDAPSLDASKEELMAFMLESGAAALIHQRPYNVAVQPSETPRDIFISTFDTAPLAADLSLVIQGKEAAFQAGLDVLNALTDGNVYLGLDGRDGANVSTAYSEATGVEKTYFKGAHPAGNVGIQIHHTAPINKGDVVWTVDPQSVATIGSLFTEGKYDASRVVAVTGDSFESNHYVHTHQGANIENFGTTTNEKARFISGNILTGRQIDSNGHVGLFDNQISTLTEGDYYEMFGWLLPIKSRASISPTIPMLFYPDKLSGDTNTHGEKRAFVVTGQYESVTPMDIYPQHLLKAIIVNDYERMEGLGIYELVEEDLALCEFVCASKQDVQATLRRGLNMMIEQG